MDYTKQNFVSGQVLKAEHMNHIEDGIVQNTEAINTINDTLSNKAASDHTHSEYLTSVPSDYKTKTENDTLYQPIGNYATSDDLPTKTSELTNDSGFITDLPTIPTKMSELINDKGFVTADQMNDGSIPELTSPVFIWNLEYGVYKLPENCVVHYRGTNAAISTTASSSSFLFVYGNLNGGSNSTDTKYFIMFRGGQLNSQGSFNTGDRYLTAGWVSESSGNYKDTNLGVGYATESYVTNAIANAQLGGGDGSIDLSNYATKDELNAKADISYVDGIVGNIATTLDEINGEEV